MSMLQICNAAKGPLKEKISYTLCLKYIIAEIYIYIYTFVLNINGATDFFVKINNSSCLF